MSLNYARVALLVFCILVTSAQAAETYGPYNAKVLRVIDGDTVQVEVAIWPGLRQVTKLRLAGVNAPEKRGRKIADCEKRAGRAATTFTRDFLQGARTVTVSGVRPGKYAGRMLGSRSGERQELGTCVARCQPCQTLPGWPPQALVPGLDLSEKQSNRTAQ